MGVARCLTQTALDIWDETCQGIHSCGSSSFPDQLSHLFHVIVPNDGASSAEIQFGSTIAPGAAMTKAWALDDFRVQIYFQI